jgi:5-methylcytosine-specific restriction endonuclease McrA
MKKELREKVWAKYGKRCAYCGKPLTYKQLQVDHIEPVIRGGGGFRPGADVPEEVRKLLGTTGANDSFDNLNPSCARCNNWKHAMKLETFRAEIARQTERLARDRSQYRIALDYGLIVETGNPVVFYFEKEPEGDNHGI